MTDFGARFTKARDAQGVSLDQIASETRISTRFLRAIEQEEFQILPGGIFNRGFIRTYAQRVGLDPEQAVADYERVFTPTVPEPLASVVKEVQSAHVTEAAATARPRRDYYPVIVGALILLITIFYVLNRNSSTSEHIVPSPATQVVEAAEPAVISTDAEGPGIVGEATQPETVLEQPAAQPLLPDSGPAPATRVAGALVLELEVSGVTWIRLSADGTVVEDVILQPGHARRYTAQNTLEISIGNAGGVSMKVNGRDVGSLGVEGRARRFLITPDNASTIRG